MVISADAVNQRPPFLQCEGTCIRVGTPGSRRWGLSWRLEITAVYLDDVGEGECN